MHVQFTAKDVALIAKLICANCQPFCNTPR